MTDTLATIVLAAGRGTRMKSRRPKLLHTACGRPLLAWSLGAVEPLGADPAVVVIPPDEPELAALVPGWAAAAVQQTARGTGDAVLAARAALDAFAGDVLILNADHPLIEAETLQALIEAHREAGAAATLLVFERTAAVGADFGRIVRGPSGDVAAIVEVRDATPEQRAIAEVNSGYYVVRADLLWSALDRVTDDNDQGEIYLTDIVGILHGDGERVHAHVHDDPLVAKGVNTRVDLSEADAELRARINRRHQLDGVTIVDPASTFIEPTVQIEADAVIHPFTVLRGDTRIGAGAHVGPHVVAADATIGRDALVGPFCYLRPGATLLDGAKAGTYVEIKNSVLGEGAKVPHLSYIGDAEVGSGTNIGAGAITANYDGTRKQRTVIGKDVHTSSHNVFVAPVTIGDGAWTAAGSVITDDIPPDALGVARAKQTNIPGYGTRKRRQR
ncbi:MAG TPA: bifunctional UDP-N-acetylglucosamine diphosphorylase/glucosamine-1-phosphate N-acetyltransferase GlmU [Gaiellales bacterium]|nr:bifunctional UDP-N-acetylglucosamine diphosphorylase/glucosamine-1-phosphate N-acetyltransferase GlmU [Gaiellales bacterium]